MTPGMIMEPTDAASGMEGAGLGRREARLRPQHASRYPGIGAGEWLSAATLADRVLAGALLRGRDTSLRGRLLRAEHFEFRGGWARVEGEAGRPRREDR